MASVAVVIRWSIAYVLGLGAIGKILDPHAVRAAIGLSVSPRLASLGAALLIAVESGTSISLLVFTSVAPDAIAFTILFGFTVYALLPHVQHRDCACLGSFADAPVGKPLAARNALLTILAALALRWNPHSMFHATPMLCGIILGNILVVTGVSEALIDAWRDSGLPAPGGGVWRHLVGR